MFWIVEQVTHAFPCAKYKTKTKTSKIIKEAKKRKKLNFKQNINVFIAVQKTKKKYFKQEQKKPTTSTIRQNKLRNL